MTPVIQFIKKQIVSEQSNNKPVRFQVYTEHQLEKIEALQQLPEQQRFEMKVVAKILPFRVNEYVIDNLIDWNNIPDDPIFQLVFPQKGMLSEADFAQMATLLRRGADRHLIQQTVHEIRQRLNPHPAGQLSLNVPREENERMEGIQHKYRETVLFFPSQGQVCHSFCSFCFRWAQFIGDKELRFSNKEAMQLYRYLSRHESISDLLITGGDPMVMKTDHLANYLEPLLTPELAHIQTIRIGTKSLSFWPQRFVHDADAGELLTLLKRMVQSGKHVAIMAHYNHWREMTTPIAQEAIRRLRETGAVIRTQSPLLNTINNDPAIWARMWREQVRLGMVPYYMFVERDTGARHYFEVPLARAWDVYRKAMQQVSGLGRTVRGPSMSAGPGKVEIQGVTHINKEKVFVLRFVQGRNPDWVQQPFFAKYDAEATWLDQLKPAFGESRFFFQDEYDAMCEEKINPRTYV
ncbi:L-lysine 2,3-aminomutase [Nitrosomonas cryotolerans]|uniref:L-lysine 2,3-aminomutase n=1 Tax=Nitrosomonas cryotolerans ATCC 49181 TaxID=1131553 RepID=A0A1N6G3C8_9PROT|nr:lysine 2,3-aminomutase [Nitrosomonas cryotolerans]SFP52745.1 L-lysine 2,3-aminomutase [Nitrosomonas cryotolerans]SIO02013.1 L-lysine 2,3-aminomutase [Nitrosomonas cryotolerans ATCC 49181]